MTCHSSRNARQRPLLAGNGRPSAAVYHLRRSAYDLPYLLQGLNDFFKVVRYQPSASVLGIGRGGSQNQLRL